MAASTFVRRLGVLAQQLASSDATALSSVPLGAAGYSSSSSAGKPARPVPLKKGYFRHFETCNTRWEDQDCYRHVNNVVTYSFFDTAINRHLITATGFDPTQAGEVGFVVNSSCDYFKPFGFPSIVHVGIAVPGVREMKETASSVRYLLALFIDDGDIAVSQGFFTHVWVNAQTQRPVPIPQSIRKAISNLSPNDS